MKAEILKLTLNTEDGELDVKMSNNLPTVLAGIHSALDELAERNHTTTISLLCILLNVSIDYYETH